MDFELDSSDKIESLTEKPLKLYRGYIPGTQEIRRTNSESGLIQKIIESGENPHDEKYADKLIWVTPDEEYAGVVAISRSLVDMALDSDYREEVLTKGEKIPRIDEYALPKDTDIFDGQGQTIVPLDKGTTSSQILIQNLEGSEIKTKKLSQESLQRAESFLSDKEDRDKFLKPSMLIDINTGFNYLSDRIKERGKDAFDEMTFEEGVRDMWEYYRSKGVSLSRFRELMGKGLLAMTSLTLKDEFKFE